MAPIQSRQGHRVRANHQANGVPMLYSSGTTGQPKGVVRPTAGHLVALNWTMRAIYDVGPGDVFWAASDVGWVVGHSYIVYAPLLHGCTTVFYEGKPIMTPDAGAVTFSVALASVVQKDRLVLLLAAGLVGYGSGLLFLFTGAPDVAYTQFTVETVFVIVVASVLLALKRQKMSAGLDEPLWRPGAFTAAAGFGAVVTGLLLVATAGDFNPALSQFFAERSVPEAYGRNVVNVILVDFRALDTLGEITVLPVAALGALVLARSAQIVPSAAPQAENLLILQTATRLLMPLLLLASLFLLWRGHNEPGGGFIAGLIVSIAVLVKSADWFVEFAGRHAGLHVRADHAQHFRGQPAGYPHLVDLLI